MQKITKVRGVKGAASWCALAAIGYLAARALFDVLLSFLMGLRVEGASLANPIGFSQTEAGVLSMLASAAAILVPVLLLLRLTRLQAEDLRLLWPMPWSPLFCLSLFLGVANAANLFGSLLARLLGTSGGGQSLPAGGSALLVSFLSLCVIPALLEELFFRGALQGLMRPSGSAAAIFGPALLFALLHLDLAQGITAFVCGVFLGWLTERTGSILPEPGAIALWAAIISIVSKELLYRYTVMVGRKLNSPAVMANAWHHRSDAFSSIGTAIGIGGAILLGNQWHILDPLAAAIVSFFIIKVSLSLLKNSVDELTERSLPDDVEEEIINTAMQVPEISEIHNLRTRRIGNEYAIEMHIRMDGNIPLYEAHCKATAVERKLKERFGPNTHIGIHTEPIKVNGVYPNECPTCSSSQK